MKTVESSGGGRFERATAKVVVAVGLFVFFLQVQLKSVVEELPAKLETVLAPNSVLVSWLVWPEPS